VSDRWTVRGVVFLLGALAIVGVVFVGLLSLDGKSIPDALTALTSGASGALGAMLARTSVEDSSGGGGGV
jgi:hypothetical protein